MANLYPCGEWLIRTISAGRLRDNTQEAEDQFGRQGRQDCKTVGRGRRRSRSRSAGAEKLLPDQQYLPLLTPMGLTGTLGPLGVDTMNTERTLVLESLLISHVYNNLFARNYIFSISKHIAKKFPSKPIPH